MGTPYPELMILWTACMVLSGSLHCDLKSGYWQVELEEEAKPLTAFTMGPLASGSVRECPLASPMLQQPFKG